MNSTIIIFGAALLIAVSAAILAFMGFYKKSVLINHKIQTFSVFLSILAIFIAVYEKVANPDMPEVLADCSDYSEFIPTTITCLAKIRNAKNIKWEFEDGTVIRDQLEVTREFSVPGNYEIKISGDGEGFAYNKTDEYSVPISVRERPVQKKIIETSHRFSQTSATGKTQKTVKEFHADPGYTITDARLSIDRRDNASAVIKKIDYGLVIVEFTLRSKPTFKGLEFRLEKAYISGSITLVQKEN